MQNNPSVGKRHFETKEEFVGWLKNRTKTFAIQVIQFCDTLPKKPARQVIMYQLIKSATSVAANYRAACRARSGAEFYSKLCTETMFWLEVIKESALGGMQKEHEFLITESMEITALMTSARKNAQVNK